MPEPTIRDFHAHIYFDPHELARAQDVAAAARERFGVPVGHFHERPVGPHPRGSVQLTVAAEQFGDFAIQIRMKMMTKPGEQFVIRRRAYAMIKKAFNANGIRIALPTVSVAGGGDPTAAVAQQAVEMTRPPTAAE